MALVALFEDLMTVSVEQVCAVVVRMRAGAGQGLVTICSIVYCSLVYCRSRTG